MMNTAATLMAIAAAAAPAMAAPAAAPLKLCAQTASGPGADDTSGTYEINNNVWTLPTDSTGTQCTTVDSNDDTGIAWGSDINWGKGTDSGDPISYPFSAVKIPTPKAVGDIKTMNSHADWSYDTFPKGDVAFDLFTVLDPSKPKYKNVAADFEIMVWLHSSDDVHPKGSDKGSMEQNLPFGKDKFDLYHGIDTNAETYSFVPSAGQASIGTFDGDLYPFLDYLVKNKAFDSKQLLTKFQFGSEVYTTPKEVNFKVTKFSGSVA